jgi:NADH-quinone oxidoreductase subunit C
VNDVDAHAIFDRLTAELGDAVFGFQEAVPRAHKDGVRDACLRTTPERLLEVLALLRDGPNLRFGFLQNLTAVDWPRPPKGPETIEVVYHLYSYAYRHEIVVKVEVPRARPRLPSAAGLWNNANWLEREQYDLLGVVFEGHPDLRRLLLPDDWVGHPMRKDYQEAAEYRGMSTSRPSPIDLLLRHDQHHQRAQKGGKGEPTS